MKKELYTQTTRPILVSNDICCRSRRQHGGCVTRDNQIRHKSWPIVTSPIYRTIRLIPNPLSQACNKVPVLSGQCNFLDNEFIPLNIVTFESYLLDIFSSITSCLSTDYRTIFHDFRACRSEKKRDRKCSLVLLYFVVFQ